MTTNELADQINGGYRCPTAAGPAWRAAMLAGVDMSLLDLKLARTPWQRLVEHDAALRFAAMLRRAGEKQRRGKS